MMNYSLDKKPAFFPFVSAEIFFEADAATDTEFDIETAGVDLDAELDQLLSVA